MAENQVSIIPNLEAICREAAGIEMFMRISTCGVTRDDPTTGYMRGFDRYLN